MIRKRGEGFFRLADPQGPLKGKSIASVVNSRRMRNELVALFGRPDLVPSSVMRSRKLKIESEFDEIISNGRRYYESASNSKESKDPSYPEELRSAFKISGSGCCNGALSAFHQEIGRSMVLLYTKPGDTVFDPFAGHNSRMDLCVKEGRHYVGCDLSHEFMRFNRKRAKRLRRMYPFLNITLHEGDSRKVPVLSDSADFTITSPPYYDIEYYGDEAEQLGNSATYEDFLGGMKQVLAEDFRILRDGSFAIWFVNDFRRKGKFHLYHCDLICLAEEVGFAPFDILIVDLIRTMRDCFLKQIVDTRILPKRHEYGLVFVKRGKKKSVLTSNKRFFKKGDAE